MSAGERFCAFFKDAKTRKPQPDRSGYGLRAVFEGLYMKKEAININRTESRKTVYIRTTPSLVIMVIQQS